MYKLYNSTVQCSSIFLIKINCKGNLAIRSRGHALGQRKKQLEVCPCVAHCTQNKAGNTQQCVSGMFMLIRTIYPHVSCLFDTICLVKINQQFS